MERAMRWIRANPVFPVADVAASIAWYRSRLGLAPAHVNTATGGPNYAVLAHGGRSVLHLLLCEQAPHDLIAPVQAQFWIEGDLDALFTHVTAVGAKVLQPPADQAWGHRDFMVADPDGNVVWVTAQTPAETVRTGNGAA